MEKIINVAQYVFKEYKRVTGEVIDEMKLHKLLYFAQRESLAITNTPLFEEEFEGWKYGPVCKEIRNSITPDGIIDVSGDISDEGKYIVNNVILVLHPGNSVNCPIKKLPGKTQDLGSTKEKTEIVN